MRCFVEWIAVIRDVYDRLIANPGRDVARVKRRRYIFEGHFRSVRVHIYSL
jgi:hypothetical protein